MRQSVPKEKVTLHLVATKGVSVLGVRAGQGLEA